MLNRLVAENVVKTPFKGEAIFSINKKMLAYSTEKAIKIKTFQKNSQILELLSSTNQKISKFGLLQKRPWVCTVSEGNIFEVNQIDSKKEQMFQVLVTIRDVVSFQQTNDDCLILEGADKVFRTLSFDALDKVRGKQINLNTLNSIIQSKQSQITPVISQDCQNIYVSTNSVPTDSGSGKTIIFSKKKTQKYEKSLQLEYLHNPIAIYRDRYAFQLSQPCKETPTNSNIQIFDIYEGKLRGQIQIQGQFKFAKILQNLLIIIMNVDNTDYYWFYVLNNKPTETSSLITHRAVYQKGKGDYYDFVNMSLAEAQSFGDKKKEIISDVLPQTVTNETASVIYVMNKQKEKVEIVKLDHQKLLNSPFKEHKVDKVMKSVTVQNNVELDKAKQNVEGQRNRIKSTIDHTIHKKTTEEAQKRFVQALIDTKIKVMMRKFEQLEHRVQKLEKTMKGIYEKIDENIKSINREEIKESVSQLFDQLTPQFEKYFNELFKQVSGVLDQGVSYYNKKLSTEADLHKHALSEIVTKTFESTEEIIKLSKKEEKLSENTERHLKNLVDSRNEWQRKTDEFEQRNKELSMKIKSPKQSGDGKVFVKADLGSGPRRQT